MADGNAYIDMLTRAIEGLDEFGIRQALRLVPMTSNAYSAAMAILPSISPSAAQQRQVIDTEEIASGKVATEDDLAQLGAQRRWSALDRQIAKSQMAVYSIIELSRVMLEMNECVARISREGTNAIRARAVYVAGWLNDEQAVVAALADEDPQVRCTAIRCVGEASRFHSVESRAALVGMLSDPASEVVAEASRTLAKMGTAGEEYRIALADALRVVTARAASDSVLDAIIALSQSASQIGALSDDYLSAIVNSLIRSRRCTTKLHALGLLAEIDQIGPDAADAVRSVVGTNHFLDHVANKVLERLPPDSR